MKKSVLFLSILLTVLFSCNSNDNEPLQDQVIGNWKLFKHTKNGVEDSLSDCDKQSSFVYNTDGSYREVIVRNGVNGSCRNVETRDGTWENAGNGFYNLKLNNSSAGSNTKYIFKGNTYYVEYTINKKLNKVYYQKN